MPSLFAAVTFDQTINLGDVLIFGGGILAVYRAWLAMRRDVKTMKRQIGDHDDRLDEHESVLVKSGWWKHRDLRRRSRDDEGRDEGILL